MTLFELASACNAPFDLSRGFADLPFAQGAMPADDAGRPGSLEFALMGLAGEVGEVAGNTQKGATRGGAVWLY